MLKLKSLNDKKLSKEELCKINGGEKTKIVGVYTRWREIDCPEGFGGCDGCWECYTEVHYSTTNWLGRVTSTSTSEDRC